MKNAITTFLVILFINLSFSQKKLVTRTGKVTFTSETPIENIYAENNQAASIFLISKKVIVFNVLLKSFKFEKALMEEHFNEKYVHSETYPAAKFKGALDINIDPRIPKVYENVTINGEMSFHNEIKPLTIIAKIEVKDDNTIVLIAKFKLKLDDYKIEIPALVKDKIASDILVEIAAIYK